MRYAKTLKEKLELEKEFIVTIMNKQEIMEVIEALAHSQSYYARLYDILKEHPEALEFLEKQNFKKPIDIIMFLEN